MLCSIKFSQMNLETKLTMWIQTTDGQRTTCDEKAYLNHSAGFKKLFINSIHKYLYIPLQIINKKEIRWTKIINFIIKKAIQLKLGLGFWFCNKHKRKNIKYKAFQKKKKLYNDKNLNTKFDIYRCGKLQWFLKKKLLS